MRTLDLRKTLRHLYRPSTRDVVFVDVPEMALLMVDGTGDPETSAAYRAAIELLYAMAYTLKFLIRKRRGLDYPVMPLEGLWWAPENSPLEDRDAWRWTMMIMQPDAVTPEDVRDAADQVRAKKPHLDPSGVRLERLAEGRAAQIMHLGPYAAEGPTIERLHAAIAGLGLRPRGRHHEIYLSDPRRTSPDRIKTVIRQPVA